VFEANVGDVEQDDLPRLRAPMPGQSAQVLAMYRSLASLNSSGLTSVWSWC
jgi:hypothetical protein